jgi:cytochrome bd-type quinol oxidase subunit 1
VGHYFIKLTNNILTRVNTLELSHQTHRRTVEASLPFSFVSFILLFLCLFLLPSFLLMNQITLIQGEEQQGEGEEQEDDETLKK